MRCLPKLLAIIPLIAGIGFAQEPAAPPDASPEPTTVFNVTTRRVVAPTTVTEKSSGVILDDLKPSEFKLLDNGREQSINVDPSQVPLSVVVAIQANAAMDPVLSKIKKIGPLIAGLITGDEGEAAITCFDHRIQLLSDFSNQEGVLNHGLDKLRAGSSSSRLLDGVQDAIRRLKSRPGNKRRVVILISESRDNGSESRLKEVLSYAQVNNVIIYSVPINRLIPGLEGKVAVPRPDPIPPGGRYIPGGGPNTPLEAERLTGTHGTGINFLPAFEEIFKSAKYVVVDNPTQAVAKYTGGTEIGFASGRGLESAFERVGSELHTQYLLTYSPNNKSEQGYHTIQVVVARRGVEVRTRPGYYNGLASPTAPE